MGLMVSYDKVRCGVPWVQPFYIWTSNCWVQQNKVPNFTVWSTWRERILILYILLLSIKCDYLFLFFYYYHWTLKHLKALLFEVLHYHMYIGTSRRSWVLSLIAYGRPLAFMLKRILCQMSIMKLPAYLYLNLFNIVSSW